MVEADMRPEASGDVLKDTTAEIMTPRWSWSAGDTYGSIPLITVLR
jgi:hypothetical protein